MQASWCNLYVRGLPPVNLAQLEPIPTPLRCSVYVPAARDVIVFSFAMVAVSGLYMLDTHCSVLLFVVVLLLLLLLNEN